jgi:UDP:flavonoid glycosyltransferase YjiC (YdhE family)
MTSVLAVPFSSPGHTQPMAALARQLRQHGLETTLFDQGAPGRSGSSGRPPVKGDAGALFRHVLLGSVVDTTHALVRAARACRAQLIVGDLFAPAAGLAADLAGLPWVSLSCSPVPALDAYRVFLPPHAVDSFASDSTLDELGLAGDGGNLLGRISPYLHLIPTTTRLAGCLPPPGRCAFVGPLVPLPPSSRPAPDEPIAIAVTASTNPPATLGSRIFVQRRYVAAAAEAIDSLGARAVMAAQPAGRSAGGPHSAGWVAHDEVFDRCTAVVTHAGWGTVSRALVRGLPLVLVPVIGDQEYIAARCSALGVGIALDGTSMTVADMRSAIREVIVNPTYRKTAAELAVELRAASPLATAASAIGSVCARDDRP